MNAEATPTLLQAGYAQTWFGRFKAGLFQKFGGFIKYINLLVGGNPRAMHAWQTIAGQKYLCVGSTAELGVFVNGTHQIVTPQTFLSDVTPSFTTTIGSTLVTVADTNVSTITPYDSVFFNTPISIDGIILSGRYAVVTNLSATTYTITAATAGVAGAIAGGTVPSFTTASGSPNVTVTLAAHGLVAGNDVVFPLATVIGGLTISGRYIVVSKTDADNFVISSATAATSTAGPTSMNSGKAELLYSISMGPSQPGGAYGAGNYGAGAYGLGVALIGQTGTPITATDWTLGNWGQDLVACPQGGGLYYWDPTSGFLNASLMPNSPVYNSGAFISTAQQMVIAYGSTVPASMGVYQDPMWINWCDIQNFSLWTPATTNQAGGFRIPSGSQIVGGAATPTSNLIWTDIALWVMTYIGTPFVFGFLEAGSNCGLIGKHAFAKMAGNVYWFGLNNFFALAGGSVSVMPCSVWDAVFQDLDTANAAKCWVGSNTLFSELLFAYPSVSGGLGIPDKYAKFNIVENAWDTGVLQRNCWIDQTVFGPPLACDNNGTIYQHESGFDADTSPMVSGFTTGYFYLDEGREYTSIDRIIPDFRWGDFAGAQTATLQISVNAINDMSDTPRVYGPFTVTAATKFIPVRIRARQISLTVQSSDSGSFWRLGHCRFRFQTSGLR